MRVNVDRSQFGRILDDHQITAAAVAVAEEIAAAARGLAPHDSGEYAAGIEVSSERVGVKNPRMGAVVTATADHSAAVEFGNSRMRAQHVLTRAAESVR